MIFNKIPTCNLIVIFIMFLQNYTAQAQQLPLINQNRESLNPAFISSDYFKFDLSSNATLRYRQQWTDVKGAPRTILGSFTHFDEDNSFSYGGDLIHDETGPTGFSGVYGRASYAFELSRDLLLSAGLKGGVVQYRVKGNELNFLEPGDIANNSITKLFPDFSLGAMLYYQKHYYLGFSVPQVLGLDLEFKDDADEYSVERVRHYYGIIGARFDLGDGSWIEASSEARFVEDIPFYINGRLQFDFRDLFWVAANTSSSKEFGAEIGVLRYIGTNSNLLRFGYSFSNFFQKYGPHFGVVHELGASFSF